MMKFEEKKCRKREKKMKSELGTHQDRCLLLWRCRRRCPCPSPPWCWGCSGVSRKRAAAGRARRRWGKPRRRRRRACRRRRWPTRWGGGAAPSCSAAAWRRWRPFCGPRGRGRRRWAAGRPPVRSARCRSGRSRGRWPQPPPRVRCWSHGPRADSRCTREGRTSVGCRWRPSAGSSPSPSCSNHLQHKRVLF